MVNKIFPGGIYVNTNLADKFIDMLQLQKEINKILYESEDKFKRSLARYMDRLYWLFWNGHYAVLHGFCYVELLRYYYLEPHVKESDWPLPNEILDKDFPNQVTPSVMPLISSKDKLKCRKAPFVLRFFTPNKNKIFEIYTHHVFLL